MARRFEATSRTYLSRNGHPDLLRTGERASLCGEPTPVVADVARLAAIGFQGARDLDTGLPDTADWWSVKVSEADRYGG